MKKQGFRMLVVGLALSFSACFGSPEQGVVGSQPSLVERGKILIGAKNCISCHSSDGSRLVGPSYKGMFGKTEKFTDGTSLVVDENYIRESIESPMAKIVEGYPPTMPAYKGLIKEDEIVAITEYIKSLK